MKNMLTKNPDPQCSLVGGMWALGIGTDGHGVFSDKLGKLTNDFFVRRLATKICEWLCRYLD